MNLQLFLDMLFNLVVVGAGAYLYFDKARQTLRYARHWLTTRS